MSSDLPSRRSLPQVARLLAAPELASLLSRHPRALVVEALRAELAALRVRAAAGTLASDELLPAAIAVRAGARLAAAERPYYRRVVNATGVVLHTNLGRAPLAPAAVAALAATGGGAQRLEMDLDTGDRGGRDRGCGLLLERLTGCEAAAITNNNAAATLLSLAALARGKRVLVSRGELVEIGGSYRIPEIMAESGALLTEVGATNRTHLKDYQRALSPEVGMILKVHPSNYRIEGFTSEVELPELVALGKEHGIPVVHDLGSGCLVDLARHGIRGEPGVGASVAAGADLVCFSGDKLLGGPQAGLLVGKRWAVEACRKQPLFRALRPGRLIYAALEATLRLYLPGEAHALAEVPALARLTLSVAELKGRAGRCAAKLRRVSGLTVRAVACASQAGSGSLPAREIPSYGLELSRDGWTGEELAAALRRGDPAVVGRMEGERVLLDLRTVGLDELPLLLARLRALAPAGS